MDSVLTAPLGLRLHRNTLTRQDAVVVPTRLGLVRLRRGGSEHLPAALGRPGPGSRTAASVSGVSSVRLLAPPEVSVRPAILEDRRLAPARACCPPTTSSSPGSGASAVSGGSGHAGSKTSSIAASRAPSRAGAAGSRGNATSSSAARRASRSAPSGSAAAEASARCPSSTGSVGSAAWNRELGARLLPLLSVLMAPRDQDERSGEATGEEEEEGPGRHAGKHGLGQDRPHLTVTSITVPDMASARVALHQRQRQQRASRTTRHAVRESQWSYERVRGIFLERLKYF
ncbi:4-hydroxy-tetrahydrodipicolinate synthase [Frankliniella fusca]|uniref:4-hydroxy-tetrahydrodipicolinate synthase n=1 Tax=Frankliniella fusca TaxID=407009 RepID=A0AAE1LHU2_9NEOP|nr:4-hydroxy-tetrahydrodipicolinate synthase [Frankliniella fusca]